ncbi:MAG: outer membrane beta-barrel protein [bacterium]
MRRRFMGSLAALALIFSAVVPERARAANALELFKDIRISGFMDTYYSYNTNKPASRSAFAESGGKTVTDSGLTNRFRAFDLEDDTLVMDNFELQIERPTSAGNRAGFKLITNYGELANRITFAKNDNYGRVDDDDFTFSVAYVNYFMDLGRGVDIKVGKMATWIGAEPWESVDNLNYSRSLLYQNADPFTHTGASISYSFTDNIGVTGYAVNGWDGFEDNNRAKSLGYQVAFDNIMDKFSLYLNGIHGAEHDDDTKYQRDMFDVVLDITPMDNLEINLNYETAREQGSNSLNEDGTRKAAMAGGAWRGFSGIVAYDFADWFKLAARGEVFIDKGNAYRGEDGIKGTADDSFSNRTGVNFKEVEIYEATVTATFKLAKQILVRPEYRRDWSQKRLFVDDEDSKSGNAANGKKYQQTFLVSFAYIF